MADYVAITDAQIEPGAPGTTDLFNQLRDNPIAIAEGAPGAPGVRHSAFLSPVAGTTFPVGTVSATITSSDGAATLEVRGRCLAAGVLSYSIEVSNGNGIATLLRNGVAIDTQSGTGTKTGTVSVAYGQYLALMITPPVSGASTASVTTTCGNDAPRVFI